MPLLDNCFQLEPKQYPKKGKSMCCKNNSSNLFLQLGWRFDSEYSKATNKVGHSLIAIKWECLKTQIRLLRTCFSQRFCWVQSVREGVKVKKVCRFIISVKIKKH